jgi:hypothetical protein
MVTEQMDKEEFLISDKKVRSNKGRKIFNNESRLHKASCCR